MLSSEQQSIDRKAGIILIAVVLFILLSMMAMVIHGQLTTKDNLLSSKTLTVVKKDVSLLKTSLLLSDNEIYSVSRKFSIRLESGDELIVNRYQSKRIEICVMGKCE
ncbi:TPA: hypothetical protein P7L42_003362 [Vibrio cholerae]|uniref:hypothetical protein n=1 Tax=Vibrio cholerae TaxID=666 RepID=UPI001A1D7A66|nr:hypothetical protein [Vibrio cholerae]MCX9672214.1 hypothetical protein [Vibrio cholerae]MCX9680750.1 hypothetical protein [Vibrio cholerae]MCX9686877.1 hypothetical protein [Vibrio cholerae]MCX9698360.1 hypothetical protein [Vibrio cholerae]MCX9716043.1 hypothetical protein [Vibrio cholerae]